MKPYSLIVALLIVMGFGQVATFARPVVFPLQVSENVRYLQDSNREPFLVVGDTAWSLVAQLEQKEITLYLEDRRQRGFNAIIVNLIEHLFADRAPAKIDGIAPFLKSGDFTQPNPAYFDYAHRAVAAANERGIAVWLCPAYLGWEGKEQGFYQEIKAAGPGVLRGYGRYVGEKFKDLPNIVWMMGGDFAIPESERWTADELIAGIREGGATQIATARGGATDAVETFGDQGWLVLDEVYSYKTDLYHHFHAAYIRTPIRPFVLGETTYEGEYHSPPEQIRRQAWWAMLGGACGQFFGNSPLWHMGGPGITDLQSVPGNKDWRQALSSPGSRDIARLGKFFSNQPWSQLSPDLAGKLITGGRGENVTFSAIARTQDHRRAIAYIPSDGKEARKLIFDLSGFKAPLTATWFNPAKDTTIGPNPFKLPNQSGQSVTTPGDNGTGTNDWTLILTAE